MRLGVFDSLPAGKHQVAKGRKTCYIICSFKFMIAAIVGFFYSVIATCTLIPHLTKESILFIFLDLTNAFAQRRPNTGPASLALCQHWANVGLPFHVDSEQAGDNVTFPVAHLVGLWLATSRYWPRIQVMPISI